MSGPFPGMNPYLEDPAYVFESTGYNTSWHGMHNRLIFCASEALNSQLPVGLVADIEERIYVVEAARSIYPDVAILRTAHPPVAPLTGVQQLVSGKETDSVIALLERAAPDGVVHVSPVEMHEWYLTIRTATRPRRVITILEILSPANKAASSAGRREYLQKQQEILHSETHLLEIDLLRAGAHTVAAPYELLRESGDWDYLVCLHRSNAPHQYAFWKNHLRHPLPLIQIPLTSEEPDTVLDLQAVFDRAYDSGRYQQEIDYTVPPTPPLKQEDSEWIDALLRAKSLRE